MKSRAALLGAILFAAAALSSAALAAADEQSVANPSRIQTTSRVLTPTSQSVPVFSSAAFTLTWSGDGAVYESFALYYEGSGSPFDTYTCWSACGSGSTNFSHVYATTGTRYPIAADQYGGTSNRVTVTVY